MLAENLSIFWYQNYVNLASPYFPNIVVGQKFLKCCHISNFQNSFKRRGCGQGTLRSIASIPRALETCKDQPFFMTEISPLNNLEGNFTVYQNAIFFSTKVANSLIYCIQARGQKKFMNRFFAQIRPPQNQTIFCISPKFLSPVCKLTNKIAVKKLK